MKMNLSVLLSLFLSSLAHAAITHSNCNIASMGRLVASQAGVNETYDWARYSSIDKHFMNLGYTSVGSKDLKDLADGDLFTNMVTSYGAERDSWNGSLRWYAYTIIELRKKSSTAEGGSVLIDAGRSDNPPHPFSSFNEAYDNSVQQALNEIPLCRVEQKKDAKRN